MQNRIHSEKRVVFLHKNTFGWTIFYKNNILNQCNIIFYSILEKDLSLFL